MADNNNVNNELEKLKDNNLEKLSEKETNDVSGGVFGFDKNHADGHELSCFIGYHSKDECDKSPDGYHFWVDDDPSLGRGYNRCCKYCREVPDHNPTAS